MVERTFDIATKMDVAWAPALVLSSQQGRRRLDLIGSVETLGGKPVASPDDRIGFSDLEEIQNVLLYLDLRYGFYVIYEKTINEVATGHVFQGAATGDFIMRTERTVQTAQQIRFGAKGIPVNSNPSFIQVRNIGMLSSSFSPRLACGEMKDTVFGPNLSPSLQTLKSSGSWAVDSGKNLFVSMPLLADDPSASTLATFNFLTNGDLGTILPVAPGDARYYPGAVVR